MSESIDYAEVGLRVGLEVHQQLLTDRKLFCRCPAGRYTREHDGIVLRHMRPTLSELGVYDGTALMEFRTKKNIVYLLHRANVCTYEMDDTPPFLVDPRAIDIAIEQCLMLGCDIVDEVHIARKQYLDGSIPTGFQRTAIVGVGGRIPFRGRELSVTQVSVEEDSCREVSDQGHLIVWRTDRLGMPLIETVTGPDLRTPEEVAEAILLVGRVCRSTGHVRTGMGASRQDVNVSVAGGTRVEIKGVPKAGWAPALVHGEAVRQSQLLRLRGELASRGFRVRSDLSVSHRDVTGLCRESGFPPLCVEGWERFVAATNRRPRMEVGAGPFTVRAVRLAGMAGVLDFPTQPGRTFAFEMAGRIRVIAGLDQAPILIHDGAWPDFEGREAERRRLREAMGCADGDALVLVWGPADDTITAFEEIEARLAAALEGVPSETRQPFADGHTDFERILPGPDRMYPDTDSPPTRVTRDRVRALAAGLAPRPWDREARYGSAGVPPGTTHFLIRRGGADLVDRLAQGRDAAALRRAAFLIGERARGWARAGVPVHRIPDERWLELAALLEERPVLGDRVADLVAGLAAEPDRSAAGAAAALGLDAPPPAGWREEIAVAVAERRGEHRGLEAAARVRWQLGLALRTLRGRVPVAEVAEVVEAAVRGLAAGRVGS